MSFKDYLSEDIKIHLDIYSMKYDEEPKPKDEKLLDDALKKYNGKVKDATDKGLIIHFKNDYDVRGFKDMVGRSSNFNVEYD